MKKTITKKNLNFDKSQYSWKSNINYRKHPDLYKIGKGEQGVLICEPYKSEILPHWRFKTPKIALKSSRIIFKYFKNYLSQKDFVGADLARKFLQMGFTRARRYANYKGGRKYNPGDKTQLERGTGEADKAISAQIFYEKWQQAESNPTYQKWKKAQKKLISRSRQPVFTANKAI